LAQLRLMGLCGYCTRGYGDNYW